MLLSSSNIDYLPYGEFPSICSKSILISLSSLSKGDFSSEELACDLSLLIVLLVFLADDYYF
jgi:hypothetical protein